MEPPNSPELNPEQWTEVELLFERASGLPSVDLAALLENECIDVAVRREVISLLQHSSGALLEAEAAIVSMAASVARESDPDERLIGTRIGQYRVNAIIGHGGMGTVYRASRDDSAFERQVAIKLIRAAALSRDTQQRFRQERQILARLSHPNIALLLDGNSTPDGIPYLVMEYIDGGPITSYCEAHGLSVAQRLRLFACICEAVESAHRQHIIHRDLKPSNILVTLDGVPKLLDFGIAKLLDLSEKKGSFTMTGAQVMTPDYASPEQVRGETVSAASDVYALGLILYEILTGHKAQTIAEHSPDSFVKVVCQIEPVAPVSFNPQLAGDLDSIIRMAIRKEPARRYASAAHLAADIERYLEGQGVAAQPDTLRYRSSKFLRRHRGAFTAAALVVLSVAGGLALAYSLGALSRQPRVLRAMQLTQSGRVELGDAIASDGKSVYFTERAGGIWTLAHVSAEGGPALPLPLPPRVSSPEVFDVSHDGSALLVSGGSELSEDRSLWLVPKAGGAPRKIDDVLARSAAFSRDDSRILFVRGKSISEVRTDRGAEHRLFDLQNDLALLRVSPAPGPETLRFCLYDRDHRPFSLWEKVAGASQAQPLFEAGNARSSGRDQDHGGDWMLGGKFFVFVSRHDGISSIWIMRERHDLFSRFARNALQIYSTPLQIMGIAADPRAKRVFFSAGQERRDLVRFDAAQAQFTPYLSGTQGRYVTYSRDQRWIAFTNLPQDTLWKSRPDGKERLQLTPPSLQVARPCWSPDGSLIAFSANDQHLLRRVYVVSSAGGAPETLTPNSVNEADPGWSPDGESLVFTRFETLSFPAKHSLYVLNWKTRKAQPLPDSDDLEKPAWSFDSRYIVANRKGAELDLFDFRSGSWSVLAVGHGMTVPFWSRDSQYVYYQNLLDGAEQPIYRVRIRDGKSERLMDARQIPQSNVTGYTLSGLGPDNAPIANILRSNSDIYALDLDLP